jgi:hypothetical protein
MLGAGSEEETRKTLSKISAMSGSSVLHEVPGDFTLLLGTLDALRPRGGDLVPRQPQEEEAWRNLCRAHEHLRIAAERLLRYNQLMRESRDG